MDNDTEYSVPSMMLYASPIVFVILYSFLSGPCYVQLNPVQHKVYA